VHLLPSLVRRRLLHSFIIAREALLPPLLIADRLHALSFNDYNNEAAPTD